MQYGFEFIQHELNNSVIHQRSSDGYVNASALCKAAGRRWNDYLVRISSQEFIKVVSDRTGIDVNSLIQSITTYGLTSIWVHPKIAIHLGQWLSPEFAFQVSEWIEEWLSGGELKNNVVEITPPSAKLPPHIRRYLLNLPQIPSGHFTILQEITFILTGPLEALGYELAEQFLPDGSLGKMFCAYLRESLDYDTSLLPKYTHQYEDGRSVQANAYPYDLLPVFRKYAVNIWLPQRAPEYFKNRDSSALPFLNKVILSLPSGETATVPKIRDKKKKA